MHFGGFYGKSEIYMKYVSSFLFGAINSKDNSKFQKDLAMYKQFRGEKSWGHYAVPRFYPQSYQDLASDDWLQASWESDMKNENKLIEWQARFLSSPAGSISPDACTCGNDGTWKTRVWKPARHAKDDL